MLSPASARALASRLPWHVPRFELECQYCVGVEHGADALIRPFSNCHPAADLALQGVTGTQCPTDPSLATRQAGCLASSFKHSITTSRPPSLSPPAQLSVLSRNLPAMSGLSLEAATCHMVWLYKQAQQQTATCACAACARSCSPTTAARLAGTCTDMWSSAQQQLHGTALGNSSKPTLTFALLLAVEQSCSPHHLPAPLLWSWAIWPTVQLHVMMNARTMHAPYSALHRSLTQCAVCVCLPRCLACTARLF